MRRPCRQSHDDDVRVGDFLDSGFDFVSDVRDDLNGFAEIIAAALFGENGFVMRRWSVGCRGGFAWVKRS
jgi:hypothetical protein